jgi:hypothetical protein
MPKRNCFLLLAIFVLGNCTCGQNSISNKKPVAGGIIQLEMKLSAFGVESDDFPSIDAVIDAVRGTSSCRKWFYNPAYKDSVYSLAPSEIKKIQDILKNTNWEKMQKAYKTDKTDQPSSQIIIYTISNKYIISDYGLEGDAPLQDLYKIVYKF